MESEFEQAKNIINESENILFFTGSGISAESGIPTFRGDDGLWVKYSPSEFGTISSIFEQFKKNPKKVLYFLNDVLKVFISAKPNNSHISIGELENKIGKNITVITQNIDNLHEKAGSSKVIKLHGDLFTLKCIKCNHVISVNSDYIDKFLINLNKLFMDPLGIMENIKKFLPVCPKCGNLMRPDVVFFGESLPQYAINEAIDAVNHTNLMVIIGTSGEVYPANTFPETAKSNGVKLIEINPNRTYFTDIVDVFIKGNASEILPQLIK